MCGGVNDYSASVDCVRLWNTADLWDPETSVKKTKSGVPFRIVAGHHGGTVSKIRESLLLFFGLGVLIIHALSIFGEPLSTDRHGLTQCICLGDTNTDIDPSGQFMITATGNRGWAGESTKVVLVHERKQ